MNKPKLIIMVGNIVSGKSTWIKQFLANNYSDEGNWVVLSKDNIRRMIGAGKYIYNEKLEPIIHQSLIGMLCNFMQHDVNIILDETNIDRETRDVYLDLTKKRVSHGYDYETKAVIMLNRSKEIIENRIASRENKIEWNSTPKEIWMQVWERKQSLFEMPTEAESFDKILQIK